MRIPRIAGDRDVRRRVAHQSLFSKPDGHLPLHVVFRRGDTSAQATPNLVERAVLDAVQLLRGDAVGIDGRLVPHSGEPLDEIGGRYDLDSQVADELHRSGIDPRDVWNRAVGGILHRHSMQPSEKATKTGFELL